MHEVISNAGDEMAEIFRLIEVIQNFEYKDRNQKIQNIKEANNLFDKCNKYKEKFDNLVNEIKQQNLNSIRQQEIQYVFLTSVIFLEKYN